MTEGMRVILGAILLVLFLAVLLWPKPAPDGVVTIGGTETGFTILHFSSGPFTTLFSKDKRGNFWMQGMPTQVGIWSGRIDADQLGIRYHFVDIPASEHALPFAIEPGGTSQFKVKK